MWMHKSSQYSVCSSWKMRILRNNIDTCAQRNWINCGKRVPENIKTCRDKGCLGEIEGANKSKNQFDQSMYECASRIDWNKSSVITNFQTGNCRGFCECIEGTGG